MPAPARSPGTTKVPGIQPPLESIEALGSLMLSLKSVPWSRFNPHFTDVITDFEQLSGLLLWQRRLRDDDQNQELGEES